MNLSDPPRPASLRERLAELSLLRRLHDDPVYRGRFRIAVASGLIAIVLLSFWIARTIERREMQRVLNELAAFHDPALEIMFPQVVGDTPGHRELLESGVRLRYWIIRPAASDPARMEVRVTDAGRRLFAPVGGQILATFVAGSREVTRVLGIEGGDQSRRVRFRYRWTEIHPGIAVLGGTAPASGLEYEGEALLSYENEQWRVVHWTTPLEDAIARFRDLATPGARGP